MPWTCDYANVTVKQQGRLLYSLKPDLGATGQAIQDLQAPAVQQAVFAVSMPMVHTDGRKFLYVEPIVSDLARVPRLVADWLRQNNAVDSATTTLDVGVLAAQVDGLLNPQPPAPPTDRDLAAQQARQAFQQAKQAMAAAQELVDAKVAGAADVLAAAVTAVTSAGSLLSGQVQAQVDSASQAVTAAASAVAAVSP